MRSWARLVATNMAGLLLALCGPALAQMPQPQPVLAVTAAIPRDFPPHYSLDQDGKPTGFAIEVMDRVAQLASLQVTYLVEDTWEAVLDSVRAGRAQLIPNLGITPERRLYMDFTSPVETFELVVFLRSSTYGVGGLSDLAGRRVGTFRANHAVSLLGLQGACVSVVYDTPEEGMARLLSGDVDAFAAPLPIFRELARRARVEELIKVAGQRWSLEIGQSCKVDGTTGTMEGTPR